MTTIRLQELNLNIYMVNKRLTDQRKMRSTYIRRGELGVVANIETRIKRDEEALERYTAEYAATLNT